MIGRRDRGEYQKSDAARLFSRISAKFQFLPQLGRDPIFILYLVYSLCTVPWRFLRVAGQRVKG